jgi:selenide, water dikinase
MRNRVPRDEDEAANVHVELEVDVLRAQRLDVAADADARRVDEDVEPAVPPDVLRHEPFAIPFLGDVRSDGECTEPLCRCLYALGVARRERECEALFGKHPRDREADPSRSPGDERALCHRRILSHAYSARMATGEVRLSELVTAGGCAAKYAAGRLEELLAGFVPPEAENLLVGLSPADDAAVYKLDDERALVFTVDFFPPVVDDPRDFGAIAAANALNDVFAMGGAPLLALSVAAFPEELPTSVLADVLAGADETVREAGALLAGGHTIRDDEPKYGLAVVGIAHPDGIWAKSNATPGDALFLTKPLGTGLVLHGAKRELAGEADLAEAVRWMRMLNRDAAEAVRPFAPSAVTDVTGFGLLGHAYETASRSGVRIVLDADALPALPGALEVARAGEVTGGDSRNRDFAGEHVGVADGVPDDVVALAWDPQTAGGLLVSLPKERGAVLQATFHAADLFLARIGSIEEGSGVELRGT